MSTRTRVGLLAALCSSAMAACGGGDGGSVQAPSTGTLSIGVTDAPVDSAEKVVVRFTAIELKPEGGNATTYDIGSDKGSIDLLALQGGKRAMLLEGQTVPAGRYEWIRLLIQAEQNTNDSYILLDSGEQFPLYVPSGSESGLKLNRGFTVAVGGQSNFTIDFDLRKSVIAPPGQAPNYVLKPVLRLVNHLQVGTISGTVASSLITQSANCTPYVYVFSGEGVVPDDMDGEEDVDPLISVPVALHDASGEYRYHVAFLETGKYTVTFTCNGAADLAESQEQLTFSGTTSAEVVANQTATVNFGS